MIDPWVLKWKATTYFSRVKTQYMKLKGKKLWSVHTVGTALTTQAIEAALAPARTPSEIFRKAWNQFQYDGKKFVNTSITLVTTCNSTKRLIPNLQQCLRQVIPFFLCFCLQNRPQFKITTENTKWVIKCPTRFLITDQHNQEPEKSPNHECSAFRDHSQSQIPKFARQQLADDQNLHRAY